MSVSNTYYNCYQYEKLLGNILYNLFLRLFLRSNLMKQNNKLLWQKIIMNPD